MAYTDRQQDGSFRGVPFRLQSSDVQLGRRTAVFQIPGSELGAGYVDNGRRAWRKSLTVVVLGENYDIARNDLIEAFERSGPGELVHPYYGARNVVIDGPVGVSESSERGGVATFTFTAVEVARQRTPSLGVDLASQLEAAISDAEGTITESFGKVQGGSENFVILDAQANAFDALTTMREANAKIGAALDKPSQLASEIDAISQELATLINSPKALMGEVLNVMGSVKNAITSAGSAVSGYESAISGFLEVGAGILGVDSGDTPNRRQQAINSRRVKLDMNAAGLFAMAGAAVRFEFEDGNQATAIRDQIVSALSDLVDASEAVTTDLEDTMYGEGLLTEPDVVQAIQTVQSAVYEHLTAVAGTLTNLTEYTPGEPLPDAVVAYQIWGDAGRHEDVLARNRDKIRHPGFCPGKVTLEVPKE